MISIEGKITLIGFLTMFVVGVSDLIVVGIISPMSKAFEVQTSLIGQLVTIYAVLCCTQPGFNENNRKIP